MTQPLAVELPGAAADLWFALDAPETDPRLTAAHRDVMSDDERRRELDFVYEKDRRLYRLARALTRTVLSRYTGTDPRDLAFTRNAFGRPALTVPGGLALDFSLSHTPGIAVLSVATGRSVGVDVEDARRPVSVEPARALLGPSELADLEARSGGDRRRRFLEYWTLKESYAKARGTGLSLPLSRCEFRIGSDSVEAAIDPTLDAHPERWWFTLVSPAPGFVAAVTVSRA